MKNKEKIKTFIKGNYKDFLKHLKPKDRKKVSFNKYVKTFFSFLKDYKTFKNEPLLGIIINNKLPLLKRNYIFKNLLNFLQENQIDEYGTFTYYKGLFLNKQKYNIEFSPNKRVWFIDIEVRYN